MIVDTRRRLKEWGQWASGGEPSLGSMFKIWLGSNVSKEGEMPPHIQEVDLIVCRAEPKDRGVIIQFYTRGGTLSDKARVIGIARQTFKDRLERAEYYVNSCLDGIIA